MTRGFVSFGAWLLSEGRRRKVWTLVLSGNGGIGRRQAVTSAHRDAEHVPQRVREVRGQEAEVVGFRLVVGENLRGVLQEVGAGVELGGFGAVGEAG